MPGAAQSDILSYIQRESGLVSWFWTFCLERSVVSRRKAYPTHRRRFWLSSACIDGTLVTCRTCVCCMCMETWPWGVEAVESGHLRDRLCQMLLLAMYCSTSLSGQVHSIVAPSHECLSWLSYIDVGVSRTQIVLCCSVVEPLVLLNRTDRSEYRGIRILHKVLSLNQYM